MMVASQLAAVQRSVERYGVLQPLTVNGGSGALVVLDGFKRLESVRRLGHAEVSVRVVELGEAAAQAAIVSYNAPHRGLSELEEAWIVRSLVRKCRLRQKEVGELLSRHKSWVCRRLMLAEQLDETVQDDMRLGLVSPTAARELVRLPRGNQPAVAKVIREHGLTSRQSGELVGLVMQCADQVALEGVLADPLRYLAKPAKTDSTRSVSDPRLSEVGERLRRSLVQLEEGAVRLTQLSRRHPAQTLAAGELEVLSPLADKVAKHVHEALGWLEALECAESGRGWADA